MTTSSTVVSVRRWIDRTVNGLMAGRVIRTGPVPVACGMLAVRNTAA